MCLLRQFNSPTGIFYSTFTMIHMNKITKSLLFSIYFIDLKECALSEVLKNLCLDYTVQNSVSFKIQKIISGFYD